jgi:signal transduction histidine kinase
LASLLDRLRSAFAVHPFGETRVQGAVESDLAAQARRRARVVAWAGLLVNLPLFYVDEWLSLQNGYWAQNPTYHWGLLVWRIAAVVSLGAYLVWDRRTPRGPAPDRRLASVLGAWFVLLGGAFGIWFEPNVFAFPLYAFTLLLVAVLIHPPTRAVPGAMLATLPVIVVGAVLYGTSADVLADQIEFPPLVVALALVVNRSIYRQAYRNAESARLLERANGELSATLDELRDAQARLVEAERQAERTRISRDLHDSVGAQLSSLLAGVELARLARRAEGDSPVTLDEVEADAREALRQLRETVWALHSPEITVEGLAAQLRRFAEARARRAGMHAAVHAEGDRYGALPSAHALQLYRIGQEAVQNAVKHSGGSTVSVRVAACDGRAVVEVTDDGTFRPPVPVAGDCAPSGFGMTTMRDRAVGLGGSLDVATEAGTTVRASVPLAPAPAD